MKLTSAGLLFLLAASAMTLAIDSGIANVNPAPAHGMAQITSS